MQEPNLDEYVLENDFDESPKKGFGARLERFLDSKYFIAVVIVLVGVASFFLGRISALEERRVPVRVVSDASLNSNIPPNPPARNAVQAGGPYTKGGNRKRNYCPWIRSNCYCTKCSFSGKFFRESGGFKKRNKISLSVVRRG